MKETMKPAPVVLFVYNRADHLKKTYEALSRCDLARETDLFIFSDGPKNEQAKPQVEEVRTELKKIVVSGDFQSVTIRESEENRGLAASIIAGVTEIINQYGEVIVLEDDCVASPHLLTFMNDSLNFYERETTVGAIAGFTPQLDYPASFRDDVFLAYRSCSCAWATWADRWQDVDWELKSMQDFYKNSQLVKRLNANGADRFIRLYRQTKGNGSSWSVRFGAHLARNNQFTVYPRYSYIENVGCDETGVHSKSEDAEKMAVDISKAITNPKLVAPKVNPQLQKIMKKHYSGGLISDLKRAVGTSSIILKEYVTGGLWKTKN